MQVPLVYQRDERSGLETNLDGWKQRGVIDAQGWWEMSVVYIQYGRV